MAKFKVSFCLTLIEPKKNRMKNIDDVMGNVHLTVTPPVLW